MKSKRNEDTDRSYGIVYVGKPHVPLLPCRDINSRMTMFDGQNLAELWWTRIHRLSELETSRKLAIISWIWTKQIIVDSHGEIIKYKLNSPFVYFRSLVKDLSTPEAGMAVRNMSDQGYQNLIKPVRIPKAWRSF